MGTIWTIGSVVLSIKDGEYGEATIQTIEGVAGINAVYAHAIYELANSHQMQIGVGRLYNQEYRMNISLYQQTGNDIFLERASHYEQMMIDRYYRIKAKY